MAKKGQSKYMTHMRAARSVHLPGAGSVQSQHEFMQAKAKTNVQKGKRGGDCNRTQCQRPNAWWYNKTMQAYYCGDCAGAINESCLTKDHIASFGSKVYVMPPVISKDDYVEGGHAILINTADGQSTTFQQADTEQAAQDSFESACCITDLRPDGTPPFHYSELRDKMLRLRGLIQERYPMLELVDFV